MCNRKFFRATKPVGFLLALFFLAGFFRASAHSYLVTKRKHQLLLVRQRLHAAKKRLEAAREREKDVARQLHNAWDALHAETDKLNAVSVQVRRASLNLKFAKERLRYARYEYDKAKSLLARHLAQISEGNSADFSSFLAGTEDYAALLDRPYELGIILRQDLSAAREDKAKENRYGHEADRLQGEYHEVHAEQSNVKSRYQAYSNIAVKRQNLLNEAEQEKQVYARQVDTLEEISSTLERQLQEIIRQEEARLKVHHHFGAVGALLWPIDSHVITSPFGWRYHPIFHRDLFHTGVDIAAGMGTAIHAAADGVVIYAGWYGGYGNAVVIDHGNGLSTLYAHCSVIYVSKGESVRQGEVIAAVGSTGYATGPHLHFEVRENGQAINPMTKF